MRRSVEIAVNHDKMKVKYRHCAESKVLWSSLTSFANETYYCFSGSGYGCPLCADRGQLSVFIHSVSPASLWGDTEHSKPQITCLRLKLHRGHHIYSSNPAILPDIWKDVTLIVFYKNGHIEPGWNCSVKSSQSGRKIAGNVFPPSAVSVCSCEHVVRAWSFSTLSKFRVTDQTCSG